MSRAAAAAAALLLGLATLVPSGPTGAQQPDTADADTVPPASAERVRSLADSLAGTLIAENRTAGISIAVLRGPDTLLLEGYGEANVELDVPATPKTVYRIGSVTKQFTAALVQKLAAAGTLALEDSLARWVEVPDAWQSPETPVTLRHLLTHTSGIPSYTAVDAFWEASVRHLTHEELLAFVRDDSLAFTPGTDWSYSNTGYYLLGMVVEEATGRPYDRVLRDSVLAPLGLDRTTYCWQTPILEGRADGYTRSDSIPGRGKLDSARLVNARPLSMAPPFSAGALCSTARELVEWTRSLHGGDLLPADRLEEMTTEAALADGEGTGYGLGLSVGDLGGHRRVGHGGGINGFSSTLSHYPGEEGPEDDVTIAVLANSAAIAGGTGRVEQALARAALGLPTPEVADRPVPPELAERITGRYSVGGSLPTDVRLRDGDLYAQAEGQSEWRMLFQGTEEIDEGTAAVFRAEFNPQAVELEFLLPEDPNAPVRAFLLHQGGQTIRAERVE